MYHTALDFYEFLLIYLLIFIGSSFNLAELSDTNVDSAEISDTTDYAYYTTDYAYYTTDFAYYTDFS